MQLVANIFDSQSLQSQHYSLTTGQVRNCYGVIKSAVWLNCLAERLGSGDMSLRDMHNLANILPSNEVLIVTRRPDIAEDTWTAKSSVNLFIVARSCVFMRKKCFGRKPKSPVIAYPGDGPESPATVLWHAINTSTFARLVNYYRDLWLAKLAA